MVVRVIIALLLIWVVFQQIKIYNAVDGVNKASSSIKLLAQGLLELKGRMDRYAK